MIQITFYQFRERLMFKLTAVSLAALMFVMQSCKLYMSSEIEPAALGSNEQVTENMDAYHFFVHSDEATFELSDALLNKEGSVSGTLKRVNYELPDSTWGKQQRNTYWENHKYDINFYCKGSIDENDVLADSKDVIDFIENTRVTIKPGEMQRVTITTIDREYQIAGFALAVLIIVAVIVGTFLIVLLTAVIAKASSDETNASSDESSGNSGSGSNSNSGGSNSSGG